MANITLGTKDTFASYAVYTTKNCLIDTNRYVTCFLKDIGASKGELWATIYDVNSDNTKSHLVTQKITTSEAKIGASYAIDVCKYDTNKFVVIFKRWLDGWEVANFHYNGSVIIDFGNHYVDTLANQVWFACTDIAINKIVISAGAPKTALLWCFSLISDVLTYDISWASVSYMERMSLTKFDENKFLCAFYNNFHLFTCHGFFGD